MGNQGSAPRAILTHGWSRTGVAPALHSDIVPSRQDALRPPACDRTPTHALYLRGQHEGFEPNRGGGGLAPGREGNTLSSRARRTIHTTNYSMPADSGGRATTRAVPWRG